MRNRLKTHRKGFSLLELVVSLVILGFISAVAGVGLVQVSEGYVLARLNARTAEKGQIAISRIVKELGRVTYLDVTSGSGTQLTYSRGGTSHTITLNGSNLTYDGITLTDDVNSFSLGYQSSLSSASSTAFAQGTHYIVNISLQLTGAIGSTHTFDNRVILRRDS